MASIQQNGGISWWDRIRTRMAISYVVITLVLVLLLEGVVLTVVFWVFTQSPFPSYFALERADQAAKLYALQAAVQAGEAGLDPDTTFEPGQADSLNLNQDIDHAQFSYFQMTIPYIQPGASRPNIPAIALLIGPDERVISSSYPDRYPLSMDISQELPEDLELIRAALSGTPADGEVKDTSQGRQASVAHTVWSRDQEPIGAVYVQVAGGGAPEANLFAQVSGVLIPSGMAWLCLMLPIGMVFGVLTTRGMIRRIERLAGATARFKKGDFSQRVPVSRRDEIGQLEQQFNGMAEQLVDSFEQRQALAEQSARREERARIEQELSSARFIQQSLLPKEVPTLQGWQIDNYYLPAREVGGDLYDFLPLSDGRVGILIGDVTGKGMPAALIMATTTAMIRAAARGAASPGEVLALVNNLLRVHISPGMFATCFYAILDPESGRLCYANAGHDIPYLSREGEIIELRATGMPLGLLPDQAYPEQELTVRPQDAILFYTDGVVEAHSPEREMFSFPRLQSLLKDQNHKNDLIELLLEELKTFTGEAWDQEDDITLVWVKKAG